MNEKFKIVDTGSPYGACYPYTPTPSNGKTLESRSTRLAGSPRA